ncbi:DUF2510 domain-containing protein [Nocardioides sp. MH1]|uniref:DUF2510 domain-containing protein n=1 Tax=Nocardioides sp. MH1 TaxID=3242490 RepID=UPI003522109F
MTQAGWYPDPAGQPQTYRYWDGASWTQETTGDPYAPAPVPHPAPPPPVAPQSPPPAQPPPAPDATVLAPGGPAPGGGAYGAVPPPPQAPPPGGAYGQPPYGGGYPPSSPPPGSGGSGKVAALVAAAVVGLVVLGVLAFVGIRALSDDDSTTASDDGTGEPTTSAPTNPTTPTSPTGPETSPTAPDSTTPTDQQCKAGLPTPTTTPPKGATKVSGGRLTIPVPDGYEADTQYSSAFTFADDFTPVQKVIEQNKKTGWVSIYGVGALRKANGYDDPAQAAETVMACMAASQDLYADFVGRDPVSSGAITIDGKDAYQVTSDLRIDDPDLDVTGDVAQVIVVDTGDADTYGVFVTVVPIGDDALIAQQASFAPQIRVR